MAQSVAVVAKDGLELYCLDKVLSLRVAISGFCFELKLRLVTSSGMEIHRPEVTSLETESVDEQRDRTLYASGNGSSHASRMVASMPG